MVGSMDTFLKNWLFGNVRRKILSVLAAVVVWFIVSSSITTTRVFPRVPVRVVGFPPNKTVRGLLPNGLLNKRVSVTLTGKKEVLDRITPQDFEILIDASDKGDEWVAQITKANLVSLNSDVQLSSCVTQMSHKEELVIHLCRRITEKIPVFVLNPKGEAPEGYQFRNVWPTRLYHTVSGPEEDVKGLLSEGLELSIDMSRIRADELDMLRMQESGDDEVSYFIPDSWKKVRIPFLKDEPQPINSPEARQLRIDFLHEDMFALNSIIPVRLFYPQKTLGVLNSETLFLEANELIKEKGGVFFIERPLMVSAVSRLFLDIIRENIELVIIPSVKDNVITFHWDTQLVDPHQLEEAYVSIALSNEFDADSAIGGIKTFRQYLRQREQYLRSQFREYLRKFCLFRSPTSPFDITITSNSDGAVCAKEVEE